MAFLENSCGISALDKALVSASQDNGFLGNEVKAAVTNVVDVVEWASLLPPKARIPLPCKPFNHSFYTVENNIIVDYDFTELDTDVTPGCELFRVGDNFKNNSFLTSALKCYAAICGFCIRSKTDRHKECSRAGSPPAGKREFASGDLKCNCKFHIIVKPCAYSNKVTVNADGTEKKTSRPLWNDMYYVTIGTAVTNHSGGCNPSPQQHVMQKSRSGQYIADLSQMALFQLCNASHEGRTVNSQTIRIIAGDAMPINKHLSSQDVFNIKKKINRIVPRMKGCKDYETFRHLMHTPKSGSNVLHADNTVITADEATQIHSSVWREVMNNNYEDKRNCLNSFTEYMETMKLRDKNFQHQILADDNGEVTGCIWMTSTMRNNFELYGGFVCVDAMKRDLNTLLWPYVAVTMCNEMDSVCVGCEGIVLSEREEAYQAMLEFQVKYSRRKKDQVYGISADGFLNQKIIHGFGFTKTKFVMDYWHLFKSVLPNRFGKSTYLLIENQLRKMAHAGTEDECKKQFEDAARVLRTRSTDGHSSINVLKELYEERESFAQYSIMNIPCIRGRRGSTCSESNHSSIVIHLNGGQRSVSEYTEHPATMFRDLLIRQSCHIKKWNVELFNQQNKMKVELNRLVQSSPRNVCLEKAAKYLCLLSYERFKEACSRRKEYVSHHHEDEKGNIECLVQSKRYDDAPPRRFKLEGNGFFSRCNCHRRISFQDQCVHEIAVYDAFVPFLFAKWHKRRLTVSCSDALPGDSHETIDTIPISNAVDHDAMVSVNNVKCRKGSDGMREKRAITSVNTADHDVSSDYLSMSEPFSDISYREWQKVQREVDGAFMNAGKETKTKVMALQIEIRNALHLDGNIKQSSLTINNDETSCDVDAAFQSIILNYRKSFTPIKGNFNPVNRSLVIPNRNVRARQPNKRLMPMSERICTEVKKSKKIKASCGFCRQENHRISTCPKKEKLKSHGEEFILFNDPTAKYHHQHLIQCLETCRTVSQWDYRLNAHTDIDVSKGYKHMIIHQSFSFVNCATEPRVNIRSMFFRIGFLDGFGNEMEESGKMFFTGEALERFLYNCTRRSRQGKIFVYNRCSTGSSNALTLVGTPANSQCNKFINEECWLPLYQQVTPDDNRNETLPMVSGQCLDMNDY